MTPTAGGAEGHFQSLLAGQGYIPAAGLDLTERERAMGNKDRKTSFRSPSRRQKSCRVKRCSRPLLLTQALFASTARPRQGLLGVDFLLPHTPSYIFPASPELSARRLTLARPSLQVTHEGAEPPVPSSSTGGRRSDGVAVPPRPWR